MKSPILKTDAYLSLENNESKSFNIEAEDTVNDLYLDIEIEARTEWGYDTGDYWTAPDSWVENSNVSIISIEANDNEIKLNDEYINDCEQQLQHLAEYAECE